MQAPKVFTSRPTIVGVPITMALEHLKARRDGIKAVTEALYAFLCSETTSEKNEAARCMTFGLFIFLASDTLQQIAALESLPQKLTATPEMLMTAQTELESLEGRLEMMKAAISKVPEEIRELLRAAFIFPVESDVDRAKSHVSMIQAELEKQSAPPTDADAPKASGL